MPIEILGMGHALPSHAMSQKRAAEVVGQRLGADPARRRAVEALFRRSGVCRRRTVAFASNGSEAPDLAFYPRMEQDAPHRGPTTGARMGQYERHAARLACSAARKALAESGILPDEITHVVSVTCTGFCSPGVDVALIKRLKLDPGVGRVQVGFMGCHGALNGLRVATALATADRSARVLVCAVELCSLHFQYEWKPDFVVANALFADGAAAAMLGSAARRGAGGRWTIGSLASTLLPGTEEDMSWRIGDHGFEMTLSPRVPGLLRSEIRGWAESWLSREGLALDEVRSWAIHPGGARILTAVEEGLSLPKAATAVSRDVLAKHGNMSSPTILVILERLRAMRVPLPCVALGFGPGLCVEGALFR